MTPRRLASSNPLEEYVKFESNPKLFKDCQFGSSLAMFMSFELSYLGEAFGVQRIGRLWVFVVLRGPGGGSGRGSRWWRQLRCYLRHLALLAFEGQLQRGEKSSFLWLERRQDKSGSAFGIDHGGEDRIYPLCTRIHRGEIPFSGARWDKHNWHFGVEDSFSFIFLLVPGDRERFRLW